MKLLKIGSAIICFLLAIGISIFVGFYSYGSIGGWTKNQEAFVVDYYDQFKTSEQIVEEYVKFNSVKYRNHTPDVKLYEDYQTSNVLIDCQNKVTLDNFSFSLYTLMGDSVSKKYDYSMYFYGIDNSNIVMRNLAVVLFESVDQNDNSYLKESINKYQQTFLDPDQTLEPIYAEDNFDILSENNFFTNGNPLYDLDGKARIVSGSAQSRYLYSGSLTYTFSDSAYIKNITNLNYCDFAIFELNYEYNSKNEQIPSSINTLCVGRINNIHQTQEEYEKANEVSQGYGLETLPALECAGYYAYIKPKIIKNSLFALLISTFLGVMFYLTLLNTLKNQEQKPKKKEKIK